MNETETIRYFDRLAGEWTERYARSAHFRRRLETVLAWVERESPGCSLLDFGCGSGVMVRALVERGFTVTGVDASSQMIAAARQHLCSAAPGRCRLEVIDDGGNGGDYRRSTYHGVLCVAVLEYVRDADVLLARLAALTDVGGFLVVSVPNQTSVLRKLEWVLHRHPRLLRGAAAFAGLAGSDSYLHLQTQQFTFHTIDRPLQALGFALEGIRYQVCPSALHAFENHRRIGMNMLLKYRKRSQPQRGS
jgi:2-polyprenyl-6-hydroxyphenyl methylase/3-demethylubiquinone-9 3-methyltransferase